jgi:hypothetical protein
VLLAFVATQSTACRGPALHTGATDANPCGDTLIECYVLDWDNCLNTGAFLLPDYQNRDTSACYLDVLLPATPPDYSQDAVPDQCSGETTTSGCFLDFRDGFLDSKGNMAVT